MCCPRCNLIILNEHANRTIMISIHLGFIWACLLARLSSHPNLLCLFALNRLVHSAQSILLSEGIILHPLFHGWDFEIKGENHPGNASPELKHLTSLASNIEMSVVQIFA